MKQKVGTSFLSVVILAALAMATGCAGNAGDSGFQMAFASLYTDSEAIEKFGKKLAQDMPELTVADAEPAFTQMTMGEAKQEPGQLIDPMLGIGGMAQFAAVIAAGELDVVVCDLDNAARNARSDSFLPLSDVFTDAELAAYDGKLLSFEYIDADGYENIPTGEFTPVCGINITGNEEMKAIFGEQEVGVFIIANSDHLELAKSVLVDLAS